MLIALFCIPLIAGFLIFFLGLMRTGARLWPLISLVTLGAMLVVVSLLALDVHDGTTMSYQVGGWSEPIGITLRLDGLAVYLSLLGLGIVFLAGIYAWGQGEYGAVFYGTLLVMTASMEGVLLTGDVFNLFVCFEILSVCTYVLIAYHHRTRSLKAALDYLFISTLGFSFYIVGVGILYRSTGVLGFESLSQVISREGLVSSPPLLMAVSLLLTGVGVKAAIFPLHTWLPDAHSEAPTSVSVILSGVMIEVSFIAMWRIVVCLGKVHFEPILLWTGALTAILGGMMALVQVDIKRILAWSSVSQMGTIIAVFGVGHPIGKIASLLQLGNHCVFKSLLFFCAGLISVKTGKRDIRNLSGLLRTMPVTSCLWIVGACTAAGVPLFCGYLSKGWVVYSLSGDPIPQILVMISSIMTVAYVARLLSILWGPLPDQPLAHARSGWMFFAPFVLAMLCVAIGVFPGFIPEMLATMVGLPTTLSEIGGLYSETKILISSLVIVSGLGIHFVLNSETGKGFLRSVRSIRVGLNVKLTLVVLACVVFFVCAYA